MAKITAISARGEFVDFDLLEIKQSLAAAPTTTEVAARETFIERRLSRKARIAQHRDIVNQIQQDAQKPPTSAPSELTDEFEKDTP